MWIYIHTYTYNGKLRYKEEFNLIIFNEIDETRRYYINWKKWYIKKTSTTCSFSYVEVKKIQPECALLINRDGKGLDDGSLNFITTYCMHMWKYTKLLIMCTINIC
jgi:hypothetical protein